MGPQGLRYYWEVGGSLSYFGRGTTGPQILLGGRGGVYHTLGVGPQGLRYYWEVGGSLSHFGCGTIGPQILLGGRGSLSYFGRGTTGPQILLGGRGEFIILWAWDHRASDTTGR